LELTGVSERRAATAPVRSVNGMTYRTGAVAVRGSWPGSKVGTMAIIVLTEVRKDMGDDYGPGEAVTHPVKVHAAPGDPDIPGDPADLTFCRKSTAGMEVRRHAPQGPGGSWYPAGLPHCETCDQALRSS
jgi:hypothetical protein